MSLLRYRKVKIKVRYRFETLERYRKTVKRRNWPRIKEVKGSDITIVYMIIMITSAVY